jgi:predicted amidohydrolase
VVPANSLRLALAQTSSLPGDVEANARTAARLVAEAASRGAQLVVFPELFMTGYELRLLEARPGAWLEAGDARLDPVRRACEAHGMTVVLGAALRTSTGERKIAAPVIGPRGDVALSLKEHVHSSEAAVFGAGSPCAPFEVQGWRVAIGICFDASKPSHAERAARDGADLYVASSFYWEGEERRLDLHMGARAMDNRVFTGLANHAGMTGGVASCGLSGAWGPSGEVLTRAEGAEEALVVVELDARELRRYREA